MPQLVTRFIPLSEAERRALARWRDEDLALVDEWAERFGGGLWKELRQSGGFSPESQRVIRKEIDGILDEAIIDTTALLVELRDIQNPTGIASWVDEMGGIIRATQAFAVTFGNGSVDEFNAFIERSGIDPEVLNQINFLNNYALKIDQQFADQALAEETSGIAATGVVGSEATSGAYANAASGRYEEIHRNAMMSGGAIWERRYRSASNSCKSCIRYQDMGVQPVGTLPRPGVSCECKSNCRCYMVFTDSQGNQIFSCVEPLPMVFIPTDPTIDGVSTPLKEVHMTKIPHSTCKELVKAALEKAAGADRWGIEIEDMYDTSVVWEDYTKGGTWQADYMINADLSVTLGAATEVVEVPTYQAVAVSADSVFSQASVVSFSGEGENQKIVRRGLLFRAGDYPDKGVSIAASDLREAVEGFTPAPVDIEHRKTLLDGKLGEVKRIWASDDGSELFGDVELPVWLDAALGDVQKKVSCAFQMKPFRLSALSLVTNPRVPDAALMSFSRDYMKTQKTGGMPTMANENDAAAEKTSAFARFTASMRALLSSPEATAAFSDSAAAEPAAPQQLPTPASAPAPAPVVAAPDASAIVAMSAQVDTLHRTLEAREAEAFTLQLIRDGRAVPAQKNALVAVFAAAAADDRTSATEVSFAVSDTEKVTLNRVEALKAAFAARPSRPVGVENIDPDKTAEMIRNAAFSGAANTSDDDDKEATKLLQFSSLGQAALDKRNQNSNAKGGR